MGMPFDPPLFSMKQPQQQFVGGGAGGGAPGSSSGMSNLFPNTLMVGGGGGIAIKNEMDGFASQPGALGPMGSLGFNSLTLQPPLGMQASTAQVDADDFQPKSEPEVLDIAVMGPSFSVAENSEIAAALDGIYHESVISRGVGQGAAPISRGTAAAAGISALLNASGEHLPIDTGDVPKTDILNEMQNMDDLLNFFKE